MMPMPTESLMKMRWELMVWKLLCLMLTERLSAHSLQVLIRQQVKLELTVLMT